MYVGLFFKVCVVPSTLVLPLWFPTGGYSFKNITFTCFCKPTVLQIWGVLFEWFSWMLAYGFQTPKWVPHYGFGFKGYASKGTLGFLSGASVWCFPLDVKCCFLILIWTIGGVLFFILLKMFLVVVCTNQDENMEFHLFKLVQRCA